MTVRQRQIWDLLAGEECLTAKEIGHHLHISDRTVRSEIKEINREKGRELIRSKKGQGYFIEEPDGSGAVREFGRPDSEENPEWEIVRQVLFGGEVPYGELAEELYISDTLLSRIVSRVNRRMAGRCSGGGICKRGGFLAMDMSEEEKRNYYAVYITTKNLNRFFEPESFQPYFEWVDIVWIKELLLGSLGRGRSRFFDATIMRLVVEIGVMAERMAAGCLLPDERQEAGESGGRVSEGVKEASESGGRFTEAGQDAGRLSKDGRQSSARSTDAPGLCQFTEDESEHIVRSMMEALERRLNVKAPSQEYRYFRQVFRNDFYYIKETESSLARGILEDILSAVTLEYGYDFSGDEEFDQEMMAQIMGTLKRNRNRQQNINPILQRLKSQYPLEYDIAVFFGERFGRLTGCGVGEDEVVFFALHIIRAMETRMMRSPKKVALVNPFGKPVKELMRKRLEDMGECRISIGESYSLFDMPSYFPRDILAVLTTVPLEQTPDDVPVILCRNFLDYHEKEKLLTVVREEEVRSVRSYFKRLFRPSLFFTDVECASFGEVLAFMCGELKAQGYVTDEFLESVMVRENLAPTVFAMGFAVAHAMENTAAKSAAGVCILKERIPWGDVNVKIVFLLALAPNWNENMTPIYDMMIRNLMKAGVVHQLSKIKDCRTFVEELL